MEGWKDGWMDGWMGAWDIFQHGWVDGYIDGRMGGWIAVCSLENSGLGKGQGSAAPAARDFGLSCYRLPTQPYPINDGKMLQKTPFWHRHQ